MCVCLLVWFTMASADSFYTYSFSYSIVSLVWGQEYDWPSSNEYIWCTWSKSTRSKTPQTNKIWKNSHNYLALIATGSVLSDTPFRNLLADGIENSCYAKESLHKLHMWENLCGNWSLFRAPLTGPTISCQFLLSLWFPFHNWRTFSSTFAGAHFVKHRRNDPQFSLS